MIKIKRALKVIAQLPVPTKKRIKKKKLIHKMIRKIRKLKRLQTNKIKIVKLLKRKKRKKKLKK